jgi:ABC-2 type transport system ATP-binding protein
MAQAAICMDQVSRDFGSIRAVRNLTLDVPAGLIFGFLGPNGAGKTTTIHILLGLLEPSAGHATVLGFDTRTEADQIRTRTGALLEHLGLYEQMSAEDNLEFYGRVWRLPAAERQARIQELLTHFGLWERRQELVVKWSRGMKQKLAVARTLIHRPALVFLDEPTAGLDVAAAAALRDDLAVLAARDGVIVFLTTHNMTEAEKLCHRVAVIREGELVALGHPDELRARAKGPRVEVVGRKITAHVVDLLQSQPEVANAKANNNKLSIELQEGADVAKLVSLLVGEGVQVEEVSRDRASLEDVFLDLMED